MNPKYDVKLARVLNESVAMDPALKKLWLIGATFTVILTSIIAKSDPITTVTSVVGVFFVVCAAFGHKLTNFFGALMNACLAYLSYEAGFFNNVFMHTVIVLAHLYGWFYWHNNRVDDKVIKRSMSFSQSTKLFAVLVVMITLSATNAYVIGSNLWFLDGVTAVLPIAATYLLIFAYREQWNLWIPFNLLAFLMWYLAASESPTLVPVMVMKLVFIINSFFGYYEWKNDS